MNPTNRTVITKEGATRKRDRMIAEALYKRYPAIYAELECEAKSQMNFDQINPFAKVAGAHHGHMSDTHKTKLDQKRHLMELAMEAGHVAIDMRVPMNQFGVK